eukprot:scaffold5373_cov68-Phaeocystis_antarctica.AAC.8
MPHHYNQPLGRARCASPPALEAAPCDVTLAKRACLMLRAASLFAFARVANALKVRAVAAGSSPPVASRFAGSGGGGGADTLAGNLPFVETRLRLRSVGGLPPVALRFAGGGGGGSGVDTLAGRDCSGGAALCADTSNSSISSSRSSVSASRPPSQSMIP